MIISKPFDLIAVGSIHQQHTLPEVVAGRKIRWQTREKPRFVAAFKPHAGQQMLGISTVGNPEPAKPEIWLADFANDRPSERSFFTVHEILDPRRFEAIRNVNRAKAYVVRSLSVPAFADCLGDRFAANMHARTDCG